MTAQSRHDGPLLPWPAEHEAPDLLEDVDGDGLMVFVPAIMSAGLVFSMVTLLRDLFRWSGSRARERRTALQSTATASELLRGDQPGTAAMGMLSRFSYLVTAAGLLGGAAYIAIGSIANFLRDEGYVHDIGWLLAVSLLLASTLGFVAGVALTVFHSWPTPPAWTYGPLRTAPLTVTPGRVGRGPSWALSAALLTSTLAAGIVTLVVLFAPKDALTVDRPIVNWLADQEGLDRLELLDPFGSTVISIGFVLLIGLSAFRCRVMALTYPAALAVSWLGGEAVRIIVERPRPNGPGDFQSFPSGHMVQAVFIAGLLPMALAVLFQDRRAATLNRPVLAVAVFGSALHRMHNLHHWPLDILGGILFGLVTVLAAHWMIEHRSWHQNCQGCPWSEHPAATPWSRGLFSLRKRTAQRIGWIGTLLALTASVSLIVATQIVGIPTDPENYGFTSRISSQVQIGAAIAVGLGGLLALRRKAAAAFLMAFAALTLGMFAAVQYRPAWAVALTAALLIPAILTWFAWQPNETIGAIATLAVLTITALTTTAFASRQIYGHYFGPTHPSSIVEAADWEADWLWLGGVTPSGATVVAGGLDPGELVKLTFWPEDGLADLRTESGIADEYGVSRFTLDNLEADSGYKYAVLDTDEEHDDRDEAVVDAAFRTPLAGAHDLIIAAGSCARSGTNGAVFDAIVGEQPDLYLAIGDLHYSNLESTNPDDHIRELGKAIENPGPAALFSSIPTAYVWDDHDYGPNDSGAESPARLAASIAYRLVVPHHGVDPDPEASIGQALTLGRARIILTDTRSHRAGDSMLGHEQLTWFLDEVIAASKSHAVVLWANPTPWVASSGADNWSAYPDERRRIADALVEHDITNLIMVSGDAHMVAIDDGTNTDFSSSGQGGFPLLHAAALDRPPSERGGPYSHGTFPGAGQFGKIEIRDSGGSTVRVDLVGQDWEGRELVRLGLEFETTAESES